MKQFYLSKALLKRAGGGRCITPYRDPPLPQVVNFDYSAACKGLFLGRDAVLSLRVGRESLFNSKLDQC